MKKIIIYHHIGGLETCLIKLIIVVIIYHHIGGLER